MVKYIYLAMCFLLAACDSQVTAPPEAPFGQNLSYSGTCYFQNDSGRVGDTYPAALDLAYSGQGSVYRGFFVSYDVRDSLVITLFENSAGVLQFDGMAYHNGDSAQFVAQENLGAPMITNLYYLPNKWRIFTVHRN